MKTIIIIILIVFTIQAQSIYELTPGVKGNQIVLQLSNISQTQSAENVEVKLVRESVNLKFNTTEVNVENLNEAEEKEAAFSFDVNYNVGITKTDTIEFLITDSKTIHQTKQFIFTYTQPKEFRLEQNYPNPFNPLTKIRYTIPALTPSLSQWERVVLRVYDILGNEVATLVNEEKPAGYYEVEWDASRVASGVYIYQLSTGGFTTTKKLVVLK